MLSIGKSWLLFGLVNLLIVVSVGYALFSPPSSIKRALLPGVTTHGHYQIEMDCSACHTAGMGIQQEACLKCHENELRLAKDTHPASKFNDPTNAERLQVLDAKKCTTCHREHVEEQTLVMGLTLPKDYCYHCHQETLETRPSHKNLAFDSCATAGCHNYHDNRALYENFLNKHYGEPDVLESPQTLVRSSDATDPSAQLALSDADAPQGSSHPQILDEWATTAHALAGVNCRGCHAAVPSDWSTWDTKSEVAKKKESPTETSSSPKWSDTVSAGVCANCHKNQAVSFGQGKHGMRLAHELPAMEPGFARLTMHEDASHKQLNCNACHVAHSYQTDYAAIDACLQCHNDEHSQAFKSTSHFVLWESEKAGEAPAGSGVTCATCHMPRVEDSYGDVMVQHNQNNNLRPNEKMIREVCMSCHGLQYSIDALADESLIKNCFGQPPANKVESLEWAKAWFDEKERQRQERLKKRAAK